MQMMNNGTAGRIRSTSLAPWRWLLMALVALLLLSGAGWTQPEGVSAGQAATVVADGAPLFENHDNFTVLEWMQRGTRVDVFWGPHNWLYEIRYYGTVGWTWGENLALDGAGAAASASKTSSAATGSGERWIDVNRSTGAVTLYEGNTALSVFWGSLSRSQGEGYYATASGTYRIYAKNRSLTYTPFADNYITHWVGFDPERRNGFHSYTKNASGSIIPEGGGYTAGCVALPPGDIDILYDFAQIGMRVEVHW
jgi:hypothetical protein